MIKWGMILLVVGIVLVVCGCGNNSSATSTAVGAITAYVQARGNANATDLQALSCKAWESNAGTEADSFKSMSAAVTNLSCQQTGTNGQYTLVTCKGTLTTTYNGESTTRDLATRGFQAIQEDGSWKMCGYQSGTTPTP